MPQKEQPSFEQFLLDRAERIAKSSKAGEEARTMLSVAMTRRHRAASASDRFGFFSPNGTLAWLGDKLDRAGVMADMHFLPVLRNAVTANAGAMIAGAVRVLAEPAAKNPAAGGVAKVAEGAFKYFDKHEEFWSQRLESQLAVLAQLGYGYFLRARFNPRKPGEKITEVEFADQSVPVPGEYACGACATGGPFLDEVIEAEGGLVTRCPECGAAAEVIEPPGEEKMPVPSGTRTRDAGDLELSLHPHFEFRMDERATGGGHLAAARWFEHHFLQSMEEIERENPGFEPEGAEEWSFPLKWLRALQTGQTVETEKTEADRELYEVREICLLPDEYALYRVPAGGGMRLQSPDGEPIFEIAEGERLIERFPNGFRYRVVGRKVLPGSAAEPSITAYDFRTEWVMGGFRPDAFSPWFSPLVELLQIGDDINCLYTIDIQSRERNSKTNLIYDQHAFDPESFDYDEVPTKDGFHLEENGDIARHVRVLDAPQMRQAMEGLEFLFNIAPLVGSPPPVALGVSDREDDTYGGQRLKHQRQLMLLSSYNQSKAEAKTEVFKRLLLFAQKHWPDERFNYLRARFGGEWDEQDLQAFREADLDKTLYINYAEGSETPVTLIEREQKIATVLMQVVNALPNLQQAGPLLPDLMEMFSQYAESAGLDFDFADAEGDRRLAEARYDRIREGMAAARSEDDLFVLMAHPALQPFPRENHALHIEYWTDRARALLAEREPNIVLVGICEEMMRRHEAAGVVDTQTELTNQIAGQAPATEMMQQQEAAGAEAEHGRAREAEAEREEREAGARREEQAREAEEAEKARAHEAELKQMETDSRERVAATSARAKNER